MISRALLVGAIALAVSSGQATPDTCTADGAARSGADPDLYCIELLPAADIERGSGTARLLPPSSPFGVAVSPAGDHQYDIAFSLRDLPDPSSLGPYKAYVAWATTPQLNPVVRLGEVRNGTVTLGRVAFDRFLILITAEASATPTERVGRLVLRGTSASVRMQPHDLAFLLAGLLDRKTRATADHAHHAPRNASAAGAGRRRRCIRRCRCRRR